MGCSSCGQRYTRAARSVSVNPVVAARRSQIAARRALVRKSLQAGVAPVSAPDEVKREVVVQPDVAAGVIIPPSTVEVEPATGIAISVITGGEDPSKSLGDTTVQPVSIVNGLGQGD